MYTLPYTTLFRAFARRRGCVRRRRLLLRCPQAPVSSRALQLLAHALHGLARTLQGLPSIAGGLLGRTLRLFAGRPKGLSGVLHRPAADCLGRLTGGIERLLRFADRIVDDLASVVGLSAQWRRADRRVRRIVP